MSLESFPSNWKELTLYDIAIKDGYGLVDGPFGSNLPASEYGTSGIPVIRGSNLSLGEQRFKDNDFVFVSEKTAKRLERSLCYPLDIIFTKKGSLGQTGVIPLSSKYKKYLLSSNQMKLSVNKDVADPLFVYYYVSSDASRGKIIQDSEATGVPKTNLEYLRKFSITLPPLPEQRAIARILGSLDDKIEANRRMNETLEALARTLFKSWFVDFDPVRARAEGRAPAGMDAETAALFPDSFEETDLGMVPRGWMVGKIRDIAYIEKNSLTPMDFPNEVFDYYSIPAFDEGRTPKVKIGTDIKSNKFIVRSGSVLISKLNPRISRIWRPRVESLHRSICSTEYIVILARPPFTREFLYSLFTSQTFSEDFSAMVTGTSGSHQRVKPEYLLEMDTIIPDAEIVKTFSKNIFPFFEQTINNIEESNKLAAIRDSFLPELLSGGIRENTQ